MTFNIKDIDIFKIKNSFPYWPSLLYGLIIIIILIINIDDFVTKYTSSQVFRILGYTLLIFGWYIYWQLNRVVIKKNKKNKIGIVVSIKTENNKQKIRLKNDFIKRLKDLINIHELNELINIVELNEFQTEKVYQILYDVSTLRKTDKSIQSKNPINKRWKKVLRKINGHFYLWGSIKERKDVKLKYIFEIGGRVVHEPLKLNVSNPIEEAFKYVWIKKVMFEESREALGFQFTADFLMLPVSYIIGIAAFISRDPFSALKIHEGLIQNINKFNPLPSNIKKMKNELMIYLSDECQVIARNYQLQINSEKAWKYLRKALYYDPNNYEGLLLKSIFNFDIDKNPEEAIRTCYQAKKVAKDSGTWKYNLAFLLMHLERFEEALKWYENIIKNSFKGENAVLNEVYKFNNELLESNPSHIQSYFILGLLKYKKSNNYPEAHNYFIEFLNNSKNTEKFSILIKETGRYIKELKNKMGLN